jgi:hypothetical protein
MMPERLVEYGDALRRKVKSKFKGLQAKFSRIAGGSKKAHRA